MPILHLLQLSDEENNITNNFKEEDDSSIEYIKEKEEKAEFPVLIDTDGNTESAWALFMGIEAHKHPDTNFSLVGISCVHGASSVHNAGKNVTTVLQNAGINNIGVYRGSGEALVVPLIEDQEPYHGKNGFGDAELPNIKTSFEKEHGVNFIIKNAYKYKGKLRILALGPLTNIALAYRMDPEIKKYINSIFILGGNIHGVGNATTNAEFNFASDPESAHVVLNSSLCPLYILPWETSANFSSSSHFWRVKCLGEMDTNQMSLLNEIEEKILKKNQKGWLATDPILTAALIEPKIVEQMRSVPCSVELQGIHTRGMMILDHAHRLNLPSNVNLITRINMPMYEKMLIWAAGGPYYK